MSVELGHFAAILAFALALAQCGLSFTAVAGRPALAASARTASAGALAACALAFGCLVAAYVRSDFSLVNVVANSHTDKPLLYRIAGTWGNHEGSMLLWCLIATGFAAAAARFSQHLEPALRARMIAVMGIVTAASLAYLLFASNPFLRIAEPPLQGADLNPLLQDPALALHPPFLYLGYVGFSVVFAFAIAGLLGEGAGREWARAARPWAIAAWCFLTVGITLGSYWAYYELGWGGYWFWDPVENASFMPWLAGAALVHSSIVTARRGGLAAWTALLAIITFTLCLLGAFLVRSGILTSVHAFAVDPTRGAAILAMVAAAGIGGLALYAWRAPKAADDAEFDLLSRESALVVNNLALTVSCATVLVGTLYPLFAEYVFGAAVSVGPPYFNLTFAPLMAAVMLLIPAATLSAWRRAALTPVARRLWVAALAAVAVAVWVSLQPDAAIGPVIGVGVGVWLVAGAVTDLGVRAGGRNFKPQALARLPLRVHGAAIAHAGLGLLAIGACVELGFRREQMSPMAVGDTVVFQGARITLERVEADEGPNFYIDRAVLRLEGPGGPRLLMPERRFYPAANQPTGEVAITSTLRGDLYVAFGETLPQGEGPTRWSMRFYFNPLINFVFGGALLIALGSALALVSAVRNRRTVSP
jgi:cytochrome c-type biogenesis protein CcmF